MSVDVIGIDHIYIAVSNLRKSEAFYDGVMMTVLDFKKTCSNIENDPHVHYYNRHYSFTLRPARNLEQKHDPYSPGLNHFCFRVDSKNDVDEVAKGLKELNIKFDTPRLYPEYNPDYYALFFTDPDGVRLEVTNFRKTRRDRFNNWPND
ncbi:MAG: VOC family protein [Desulfatiglans sp.]|jgi:catechol 2,3-dioxygenase-like lactoylglutathione lyase family enzyme|nr:VOC family protein [Desulfatiglans sp.]